MRKIFPGIFTFLCANTFILILTNQIKVQIPGKKIFALNNTRYKDINRYTYYFKNGKWRKHIKSVILFSMNSCFRNKYGLVLRHARFCRYFAKLLKNHENLCKKKKKIWNILKIARKLIKIKNIIIVSIKATNIVTGKNDFFFLHMCIYIWSVEDIFFRNGRKREKLSCYFKSFLLNFESS